MRTDQIAALKRIRATRDNAAVESALADLQNAAKSGEGNLMALAITAARVRYVV